MTFKKAVILYLLTVPVFFVIDMIWLGLVAKSFYRKHLGAFLGERVKWSAALVFYFLFIAGILVFVVLPGLQKQSLVYTALLGAFFGLVTYATYDLTNLATMKDWPFIVTAVDLAWGMVLTSLVGSISYMIGRALLR